MAGDWIPFEKATLDKREIALVADSLHQADLDKVLGMVLRFWCWADSQTVDGNLPGMTCLMLDTTLKTPGLAAALIKARWLRERSHGLFIPNFERHMGSSAKRRLMGALRQEKFRRNAARNAETVTSCSVSPDNTEEIGGPDCTCHAQEISAGSTLDGPVRPPPEDPPSRQPSDRPECWLTRVWVFYFAGTQRSERDHERLDKLFADMIRGGMRAEEIEAAIRDPSRTRRQTSWQFESWLKDRPKPQPKQEDYAERVRRQRAEIAREEEARKAAWAARRAAQA